MIGPNDMDGDDRAAGEKKTYNILSIDGGPAGLIQVRLLRMLEEAVPGFLAATDVFAGTSNGGWLGLFLASRMPESGPTHEEALAILDDAIAFSNATITTLNIGLLRMAWFATGIDPLTSMEPLAEVMHEALGDMTLGQLQRGAVAASFDMNAWQPHVFHWFPNRLGQASAEQRSSFTTPWAADVRSRLAGHRGGARIRVEPPRLDMNLRIAEVMLATGSLPLYISVYGNEWGRHFLDGAVIANNPSMIALSRVLEVFFGRRYLAGPARALLQTVDDPLIHPVAEGQLRRLRVLSLGTNDCIEEKQSLMQGRPGPMGWLSEIFGVAPDHPGWLPWGWIQWIYNRPLLLPDLLYTGQNEIVAEECRTMLGDRGHCRYAPPAPILETMSNALLGKPEELFRTLDETAKKLWESDLMTMPVAAALRMILVRFVKNQWVGP
jgi:hypothetical protein